MKTVNFFLVRHGETIANANGIISGISPTDLNEHGKQQAQDAAESLKNIKFNRAIASTLSRAIETAEIVLQYHPYLKLEQDTRIREKNFGLYDGKPGKTIDIDDFWARKREERWADIGGETSDEIEVRCREALNQYVEEANDNDNILLVSHGNFSLVLINRVLKAMEDVLGGDPKHIFPNGSITKFRYENGEFKIVIMPKVASEFVDEE
ncbi:MAG: histidine phosphatase family protein [Erysipelotrichaceae bacterium]|nr:histidine phosphatase family protein [Erysipelotrichaceae bacterium]